MTKMVDCKKLKGGERVKAPFMCGIGSFVHGEFGPRIIAPSGAIYGCPDKVEVFTEAEAEKRGYPSQYGRY